MRGFLLACGWPSSHFPYPFWLQLVSYRFQRSPPPWSGQSRFKCERNWLDLLWSKLVWFHVLLYKKIWWCFWISTAQLCPRCWGWLGNRWVRFFWFWSLRLWCLSSQLERYPRSSGPIDWFCPPHCLQPPNTSKLYSFAHSLLFNREGWIWFLVRCCEVPRCQLQLMTSVGKLVSMEGWGCVIEGEWTKFSK